MLNLLRMIAYLILIIVNFSLAVSQAGEVYPFSLIISFIGYIVASFFFYYYTASVALGQAKSGLTVFDFYSIYSYYVIGIIMICVGNFIPFIGLLGFLILLIYIYKIQEQINRIWNVPSASNNVLSDLIECTICGEHLALEEQERRER